jgi:DNA-binding transcriptional LysR family regulator
MEVFVAAVEQGSLAAAARRYGLTPAMAGKYLGAIEQMLQVRLLQRTTRKLVLTPAGEGYYRRCKQLLEDIDEANREASQAQTAVRGRLRLAAPVSFGTMQLGPALNSFLRLHPELQIDVLLDDRFIDLLDAGVDLAIRIGKLPDSQLAARRIANCSMNLCASPRFLQEAGYPETPPDIARLPRLVFSGAISVGDWTIYSADGQPHVIDGPCRMSGNHMAMLLSAAIEGLGLVYGPGFAFREALADGRLVDVLPSYRRNQLPIQAVFPAARHLPLKVSRFVEHLINHFAGE